MPIGTLQIFTSLADEAKPLANVIIRIFKEKDGDIIYDEHFITDLEGLSPIIPLETVSRDLSLDENNRTRPYETYHVECSLENYITEIIQNIQIFQDELSTLPINLIPDRERIRDKNISLIVDHHLLTNYGKNNISNDYTRISDCTPDYRFVEEEQLKTPERINFVLKGVVIPTQIRVHLGRPSANAQDITVDFPYYIKNVCSSEIYPTWPTEAILANIHAQVSLALNRVYTEWYRSKGYDYDITNNTAFDQAFVKNRNIFENISLLVDQVFNQYLRKRNFSEPFYAEYCDGKIAQCPGMKQWGTLTLANQGLNAIQILQRYYGTDVRLASTERIEGVKGSFDRTLRRGSDGDDVFLIQQQLNAISVNYPNIQPIYPVDGIFSEKTENAVRVFQRQFNLTVDGVVGKSTWYKINYIYLAVRKLAELNSIGRIENERSGEWPGINLRIGDRNLFVQQIQYYLSVISAYNNSISSISTIDSSFGNQTRNAVLSFQKTYGLNADGIVGQTTWNKIYEVFSSIINVTNPNDNIPVYPGLSIQLGATGNDVLAIQEALNIVSTNHPSLPILVEDGIFGNITQAAVIEFQNIYGLEVDGIVGINTWTTLFTQANIIINGNNASPTTPTYPGTALRINSRGEDVRLIQNRLNFISIYYKSIPSLTPDGIFGVKTEQSVIAFQELLGLVPDGIVGIQTWNRINEVYQELTN